MAKGHAPGTDSLGCWKWSRSSSGWGWVHTCKNSSSCYTYDSKLKCLSPRNRNEVTERLIFFFLSFTEVHMFSHKFRSRLHSMSFPFYKTKAGKVTEQVGLHGIPLSRFSSLCPAGTAKYYCLKSTSSNSATGTGLFHGAWRPASASGSGHPVC